MKANSEAFCRTAVDFQGTCAGRVQSVALRLLSERESEIEAFQPQEFWTFSVTLQLPSGGTLAAELAEVPTRKPYSGLYSMPVTV